MEKLTASDPEPPAGAVVVTAGGSRYVNDGPEYAPANWSSDAGEPETWLKVAGNYGPVRLVSIRHAQVR
jgi:hypothetical protein